MLYHKKSECLEIWYNINRFNLRILIMSDMKQFSIIKSWKMNYIIYQQLVKHYIEY